MENFQYLISRALGERFLEAQHDESSQHTFSYESPNSKELELWYLVQAYKDCLFLSRSLGSCEGGSDTACSKNDRWIKFHTQRVEEERI